jgi:menaquinone-dependent protoporphyrinogen oxidase
MTASRSPRILVAAASKHGSTHEIAAALAGFLQESAAGRASGVTARAVHLEQLPDPTGYDAVVLGSAVYVGRWLEPARHYVTEHSAELRRRPVWLFSSGPIGEPPFPPDEPHDAGPMSRMVGARGHRVFPGRIDRARLSIGERAMVTAMRAPVGDFRDWDVVRAWAEEIAGQLSTVVPGQHAQPAPSPA